VDRRASPGKGLVLAIRLQRIPIHGHCGPRPIWTAGLDGAVAQSAARAVHLSTDDAL
jgi:hypothetical protein